jgi:hypothetical protein
MDDEIAGRLTAHRAALSAIAMVLNEAAPGAFAAVIGAIATFEAAARQQNEQTAMIDELRHIRLGLEAMQPDLPKGTRAPPDQNDSGS